MFGKAVAKNDQRVAYIAPTIQQARDIAWEQLKKICRPIAVGKPNESRLEITVNTQAGGTSLIILRGWEAVETLRGQRFDFVVIDEVAQMRNFWIGWREVVRPTLPADDSTSHSEKMLLYWLIRELKPKTVVETGTHKALTTLYLAAALEANDKGHLYTADPLEQWHSQSNIDKFPELSHRITFKQIRGSQIKADNIDFLFIDGYHEDHEVLEEWKALSPRLSKSAVVVFHDCWYGNTKGVNEAIKALKLTSIWLPTKNAMRIYSKHPLKPTGPQDL